MSYSMGLVLGGRGAGRGKSPDSTGATHPWRRRKGVGKASRALGPHSIAVDCPLGLSRAGPGSRACGRAMWHTAVRAPIPGTLRGSRPSRLCCGEQFLEMPGLGAVPKFSTSWTHLTRTLEQNLTESAKDLGPPPQKSRIGGVHTCVTAAVGPDAPPAPAGPGRWTSVRRGVLSPSHHAQGPSSSTNTQAGEQPSPHPDPTTSDPPPQCLVLCIPQRPPDTCRGHPAHPCPCHFPAPSLHSSTHIHCNNVQK